MVSSGPRFNQQVTLEQLLWDPCPQLRIARKSPWDSWRRWEGAGHPNFFGPLIFKPRESGTYAGCHEPMESRPRTTKAMQDPLPTLDTWQTATGLVPTGCQKSKSHQFDLRRAAHVSIRCTYAQKLSTDALGLIRLAVSPDMCCELEGWTQATQEHSGYLYIVGRAVWRQPRW